MISRNSMQSGKNSSFKNNLLHFGLCLMALGYSVNLYAQPCVTPVNLCAEEPATFTEMDQAFPVNVGCFDAQYTAFFTFSTNELLNPGQVTISVSSVICSDLIGPQDVYAVVVQATMGDCNQAGYVPLGDCGSGNADFIFNSGDLLPDTPYLLILGTNTDPFANLCEASVTISGPAVDIDACCDGQIALGDPWLMSVIGGTQPFGQPASYTWYPPETLDNSASSDPTAYPEETTTYEVTGTVGNCTVTDFVTVFVGPPINIPNTFTPNGDLINDLWLLAGIQRFEGVLVTVFDRWGQQIYKSLGYTQPWDGTNNGKKLPTATYYYVIELNSLDIKIPPITGSVTLIH